MIEVDERLLKLFSGRERDFAPRSINTDSTWNLRPWTKASSKHHWTRNERIFNRLELCSMSTTFQYIKPQIPTFQSNFAFRNLQSAAEKHSLWDFSQYYDRQSLEISKRNFTDIFRHNICTRQSYFFATLCRQNGYMQPKPALMDRHIMQPHSRTQP